MSQTQNDMQGILKLFQKYISLIFHFRFALKSLMQHSQVLLHKDHFVQS